MITRPIFSIGKYRIEQAFDEFLDDKSQTKLLPTYKEMLIDEETVTAEKFFDQLKKDHPDHYILILKKLEAKK